MPLTRKTKDHLMTVLTDECRIAVNNCIHSIRGAHIFGPRATVRRISDCLLQVVIPSDPDPEFFEIIVQNRENVAINPKDLPKKRKR